jgi:2-keto-4-pentenoate hydratase/2-oxohepta-3-ene-1,7-dioic acid hydratase in catechol pathway
MKLCRFAGDRLGLVRNGRVDDISEFLDTLPQYTWTSPPGDSVYARLDVLRSWVTANPPKPGVPLGSVQLEAPVPRPGKIIGAPVNYHAHLIEAQSDRALHQGRRVHRIDEVGLFLKATSALAGPGHCIALPHSDRRIDHEVEVVIVVGQTGSRVSVEVAPSLIGGYCLGLDLTLRGKEDRSMRKSGDGYAILGPWVTTPDEVSAPDSIPFSLLVNDQTRQSATTSMLIRTIPELISWASHFYTLHPGDLIFTGTPSGVAALQPGDRLELRSPALGEFFVDVEGHTA